MKKKANNKKKILISVAITTVLVGILSVLFCVVFLPKYRAKQLDNDSTNVNIDTNSDIIKEADKFGVEVEEVSTEFSVAATNWMIAEMADIVLGHQTGSTNVINDIAAALQYECILATGSEEDSWINQYISRLNENGTIVVNIMNFEMGQVSEYLANVHDMEVNDEDVTGFESIIEYKASSYRYGWADYSGASEVICSISSLLGKLDYDNNNLYANNAMVYVTELSNKYASIAGQTLELNNTLVSGFEPRSAESSLSDIVIGNIGLVDYYVLESADEGYIEQPSDDEEPIVTDGETSDEDEDEYTNIDDILNNTETEIEIPENFDDTEYNNEEDDIATDD